MHALYPEPREKPAAYLSEGATLFVGGCSKKQQLYLWLRLLRLPFAVAEMAAAMLTTATLLWLPLLWLKLPDAILTTAILTTAILTTVPRAGARSEGAAAAARRRGGGGGSGGGGGAGA